MLSEYKISMWEILTAGFTDRFNIWLGYPGSLLLAITSEPWIGVLTGILLGAVAIVKHCYDILKKHQDVKVSKAEAELKEAEARAQGLENEMTEIKILEELLILKKLQREDKK